jgi:hypothetical protein
MYSKRVRKKIKGNGKETGTRGKIPSQHQETRNIQVDERRGKKEKSNICEPHYNSSKL